MRALVSVSLAATTLAIGGACSDPSPLAESAVTQGYALNVRSRPLRKARICHKGTTLWVSKAAVPAHLRHGDGLGGCAVGCSEDPALCEDGDPCTADSCEPGGDCAHVSLAGCCSADSECDDANQCTSNRCINAACTSAELPDWSLCSEAGNDGICLGGDCTTDDRCPPEMAVVDTFCVDRWEAAIDAQSPYEAPPSSTAPANSQPGVAPQGYISGVRAAEACTQAGKRLCTDQEWLRACRGPNGWLFPYGDTYDPAACNDTRSEHPLITLYGPDPPFTDLLNPQLNQLPDTVDATGTNAACVTVEGVFDMVGNLHEWTADPSGTFRGGSYLEVVFNGTGCTYANGAHNALDHEFSNGFRCCRDQD